MTKIILCVTVVIVIIIAIALYQCRAPRIYDVENFPAMASLTYNLKHSDKFISHCSSIMEKPVSNIIRPPGMWVGASAEEFVKILNDEWIQGWNKDWLNYPIIFNGKFLPHIDSTLRDLIGPVSDSINIAGLSWLKPNAVIAPHVDTETTASKGRLAYHYNILGNGSKIKIKSEIPQTPGDSLVFDSGYTHSVINGPENRLILYIDFDINKSKNYIYGKVRKGLGMASKMGFPTVNVRNTSIAPGIYEIYHPKLGTGYAFVTRAAAEIHFMRDPGQLEESICVYIVQKIPPTGDGIINAFYHGV